MSDLVVTRNWCMVRMLPEEADRMNREGKKCKAQRYIKSNFTFT